MKEIIEYCQHKVGCASLSFTNYHGLPFPGGDCNCGLDIVLASIDHLPVITSPLTFSAAQLWEKIKAELLGRKSLFHYDGLDEETQVEIDYEVGRLIAQHLEAVAAEVKP